MIKIANAESRNETKIRGEKKSGTTCIYIRVCVWGYAAMNGTTSKEKPKYRVSKGNGYPRL